MVQRKQRKQQLGDTIGFFQIRVSGKNETFDSELGVFFHSSGHRFRVPDQRGAGSTTHQANSGPKIGTDFKPVPSSTMQLAHSFLSFGIESGKSLLGSADALVRNMAQEIVRRLPGFFVGLAYDDVHPQTEPESSPDRGR